ncbi:transcriptional regulator [bacterium]|nr:transcriptional regulator [bacterium]
MKKMITLVLTLLVTVSFSYAELTVGEKPTEITLSGKLGSKVDGSTWSSNDIKDKVYLLVHADPDEADMNNAATEALKAEKFSDDVYGSIAVINMAATWLPNVAINMKLKGKQEKYPSTIYVRDFKSVLVKKWNLADDSNNIVAFDKSGKVIFSKDGQLSSDDIKNLISLIKANL